MHKKYSLSDTFQPRNSKEKKLISAFCKLKSEEEMSNFLRDLLTISEIEEFANRLEIVRLLHEKKSYLEIAKITNTSTTTVTRVAHWLYRGCGGYKKVVEKLFEKA